MGDRERAEAGSVRVPRRVVRNWERLVGAAVRSNPEAGDHSAQTEINSVMEAADEIRNDNLIVARILDDYAYCLTLQVDPRNCGENVVLFRLAPTSVLRVGASALREDPVRAKQGSFSWNFEVKRKKHVDRSNDLRDITDYISKLKEEDIVNLDAEEQASREGRAPAGEHPEYQARRTEKLRRFYEILNILNNAAEVLVKAAKPEGDSSRADKAVLLSSEEVDLVYLHWRLFTVRPGHVLSYIVCKASAAKFCYPHYGTVARDVKQFLSANTLINNSWSSSIYSRILGWTTSINEPIRRDRPMAEKLLNLCVEKVQNAEYTWGKVQKVENEKMVEKVGGAVVAHVMNMDQCHLLILRLGKVQSCLASIDQSQLLVVNPVLVLRELLQTLHDAQILIEASCITTEFQWPRAAFEQGDMNHTFSRLIYELKWHLGVLLRMMTFGTSQYDVVRSEFPINNDGQLRVEVETALLKAMKRDTEGLKQRLRSVKVADPTEQDLVDKLLNRMEAPSSDLVFLNADDFDHRGARYIGRGAFGAVLETNFLGMECAMKVFEGARGTEVDRELEKETNALKKLGNHPNLVRLYCYSRTNDACYLIMERMQMNLADVLLLKNENGDGLTILEAVALMLQIGEGLKHIHSKGAAHRDLKPANILVNLADPSSKKLSRIRSVRIADFGLTKTIAAVITCSNHTRNTGTSVYMAPEVMELGGDDQERTRYNPAKADVYSFGVVCSEILIGKSPYGGPMSKQMKEQVKAGTLRPNLLEDRRHRMGWLSAFPLRLGTLIKKCWAGNYEERPLLPEVCSELRYIKELLLMYMDRHGHNEVRWRTTPKAG